MVVSISEGAETLQPYLELDNFKPQLKRDVFKRILREWFVCFAKWFANWVL
jgi:hypothetical protein